MSAPEVSEVALFVGPERLRIDVFDRYTLDLSMLEVGAAFTFSFWYSEEARASWQRLIDPEHGVKCGHRVTFTIDGDAVLSGIVETRDVGDPDGDARGELVFVISGRDELGPATSWDADPTIGLAGRTLDNLVTALYRGLGIEAEVSLSVQEEQRRTATRVARQRRAVWAARLATLQALAARGDGAAAAILLASGTSGPRPYSITKAKHASLGESVQTVIERVVRGLGYRVWTSPGDSDEGTAVIVDRPRTGGPVLFSLLREVIGGRVTERSNVEKARETTSIREVPTEVTVFAHAPRGDAEAQVIERQVTNGFLLTPAALARVAADAPPRPKYIKSKQARSSAAAHNEASRICAEANERFRVYHATVLGHRQLGRLWAPNNRVAVRDDFLGIDETWLLVQTSFEGGRELSQKTHLALVPDGALTEIPEPEHAS